MSFVERLRSYLRRAAGSRVWWSSFPEVDIGVVRKHLLERLETLEEKLESGKIERLHQEWSSVLELFVHELVADHLNRFGRSVKQPLQDLVHTAVDAQLGLPLEGTLTWRLEVQQAAKRAWMKAVDEIDNQELFESLDPHQITTWPGTPIEAYAAEIRAVRVEADRRVTPTAIGRVALELTGMDLTRWLLQIEAEQSMGFRDSWRMSRDTARFLIKRPHGAIYEHDPTAPSIRTLGRLHDLGLVVMDSSRQHNWSYTVQDTAIPVLEEIAEGEETPLRVLARALLADDRNTSLASAQPTLAALFGEEAAAAGIRQARLVAHEVRNSLVPVQVALEGLFRALEPGPPEALARYRSRIDDGLDRVFKFVDETLRVLTIAAEPAEAFDVSSALGDAIDSVAVGEVAVARSIPTPSELPPMVGARSRFVLAIANLVRNALQSSPDRKASVAVAAALAGDGRSILVTVDDDGPGVPSELRESIFARGFSLRPGGTGMGLALTREVVEKELEGKITCTVSPLGGARFQITLPTTRGGTP
ncbi:MAG TPA: HAMP domain-containing sensor histidine kinase [Kofleriaceae bacterium]|nr:HAMP domain-containing sensor histidine kinase [Kofleriaceae bacterium]